MVCSRRLLSSVFRVAAVAGLLILGGTPGVADDATSNSVVTPKQVKWAPLPPMPPGAQVAVLYGAPNKPGPYVIRVKFPPHYKVPAHMHSDDRTYTFLSGMMYEGEGDKFSESALVAIPPGSFQSYTAKTVHFGATKDKEAIFQVNGNGPSDVTYLNPADDPRKK
jgi:hypothetical protein